MGIDDSGFRKRTVNNSLMTRQSILSTRGSKKTINAMGTPACTFKQLWDNVCTTELICLTLSISKSPSSSECYIRLNIINDSSKSPSPSINNLQSPYIIVVQVIVNTYPAEINRSTELSCQPTPKPDHRHSKVTSYGA